LLLPPVACVTARRPLLTLIAAVRDGELDEQLAQASKAAAARKSRRAA